MGIRPIHESHPITQRFGDNPTGQLPAGHPTLLAYGNYQPAGHTAHDYGAPIGAPVVAIADGRVTWAGHSSRLPGDDSPAGWASRYYWRKDFPGNCVAVEHDDVVTLYSHLDKISARAGQEVPEGTVLGLAGETGFSLGSHLHFEVVAKPFAWGNGFYGRVDPAPYTTGAHHRGRAAAATVAPKPATPGVHVVAPGETLGAIAARYGTSVAAIRQRNRYITNPDYLNIGDRIALPSSRAAVVHVVAPGETLGAIAARYGTTVPAIRARNRYITNPDYLNIGDRITLP